MAEMFKTTYESITKGNPMWNKLSIPPSKSLYSWDPNSLYIKNPPYFENINLNPPGTHSIKNAYCLLNFGDSVMTDHISPASSIHKDSPTAKYLESRGVERKDFNSYGSRRGNHEVMMRGTFANIKIVNKLLEGKVEPKTIHFPSGETLFVFDAAMKYISEGHDTIILAGEGYGAGSSRDWDAKGTKLLGVKAVIAKSFERIHRSNLVSMGVIPLCFEPAKPSQNSSRAQADASSARTRLVATPSQDAESLGLTGHEQYTIDLPERISEIRPGQDVNVVMSSGKKFVCKLRETIHYKFHNKLCSKTEHPKTKIHNTAKYNMAIFYHRNLTLHKKVV
ncbi:hypothetical protein LUZ60_000085 [Juncus effusus]|nr:hypothetical protein LUZ60_000085 [Juncus effusus]